MIDMRALTKRYGKLPVLRCIDLSIARGRVTAIVGPNAAGKTTLIKSILGLTKPTSGRVLFDGQPVNGDPAYRARIGYMPQIARFPENLTGAELLAFLQELRGTTTIERELIDRWRLADELDKPLRTLSGGTRQKVNAVMAFLFSPDLLILDEPTAGLDPLSSSILKDVILASRGEGRTFILASHIMSELEELADDIVVLLDGSVRFAGPVRDLRLQTRQSTLERAIAQVMLRREAA